MKRVFITGLMLFSLLIVVGIFFTYRTTNKSKTLNYYVQQQATLNEKDIPVNNHTDSLKLITENFERINSITKRSNIITKELSETLEGGEANFYYLDGQLEKVIVQNFGETFQITTEYYLLNQHLSFIFETLYKYNRPLYYHSKIVEENDDDEIFDLKESEIMEFIYYFNDGDLIYQSIHQINKGYSPFTSEEDYLFKEQPQITADFKELIDLVN